MAAVDAGVAPLAHRGLRSIGDLGGRKPCGTRLRYMAGCRCTACRKANSSYENERQKARRAGDWNGIVPADKARAHMLALAKKGVGRRAVHAATDIAHSILSGIRTGKRLHIRARTERAILAVTPVAASDRALISAKRSQALIANLLEEGYTEQFLADALGYATGHLQFNSDRITVRNAGRIKALHTRLTT